MNEIVLKLIDSASRNYLIIICGFVFGPIIKLLIKSYLEISIAKISNKNRFELSYQDQDGLTKTLHISSSDLDFVKLSSLAKLQSSNIHALIPSEKKAS